MADHVLIVGAGHGGVGVAAGLRASGWNGRITLVDADDEIPYERPPLSKEALIDPLFKVVPLRRPDYYETREIERVHGKAIKIDRRARALCLHDGRKLSYTKLVLATGSTPRRLRVTGAELSGVLTLKTARDSQQLGAELRPGRRVVVVGAGYIGLEVAAAAAKAGCKVTILEFQDRVMSRVTSETVSRYFEALHRSAGAELVFGAAVSGFRGRDRVEHVDTANGKSYAADVVVVGIGVVPEQSLAEDAGLEVADGVLVNDQGMTSDPSIFAVGDVTRFNEHDGASLRLECIQNAREQASAVVASIAGTALVQQSTPWFWTVQNGVRLQTVGVRRQDDEVILRGDTKSGKFSVVYLRDGRVSAVDTIGSLIDFNAAKRLVAERARLDAALVADCTVGLLQAVVSIEPEMHP